ncbi:MAG TPA: hypothetical protein VEA80_15450 [Vitreimonas sp.]|uniref:hypothetical protein n=1 Tax=Vitreimonas sp. TaxID=3069702 RepID=UPI002D39FEF0|nr:hypothetical protein [Vitreimonas sp.]HYD88869.1 hypothetical protein [Vitreimonas sp.]
MSTTPTQPNKAYWLKDGEVVEQVDQLRLAIGAGEAAPDMRRSAVWKFSTRKKTTDFFVTANTIQGDMKGSVHRTRAHFGFADPSTEPEAWVGPPLHSRHYHVLEFNELAAGEYRNVMRVGLPGFALMPKPLPIEPKKRIHLIAPPPHDHEITFGMTVVEGDWRQFEPDVGQYVGLLTGSADRHALISVRLMRYDDVDAVIANMKRNLALIDTHGRAIPEEDLSVLLWMNRAPDQHITMIELNGVRWQPKSTPTEI